MVGKRELFRISSKTAKPGQRQHDARGTADDDIESGIQHATGNGFANGNGNARPRPELWRFKDAARTALHDKRREELKKALLEGMQDRDALERYRKSDEELKAIKNKKVRKFYEDQNDHLNDWLEVDAIVKAVADDVLESMDPDPDRDGERERGGGLQTAGGNVWDFLPEEEKAKRAKAQTRAKWAININVLANIALLIGKIVARFSSGSLSLTASLVDSALDLLCTLIVWSTNRLVQWRLNALQKRFPVGRKRLEPLGILVFSIIMVISFLQILKESVEKIMPLKGTAEELPAIAVGALLATIIVKGIIWFGCIPIKTTQVQALAQDCKTDVVFNTLSLLFPFIGAKANIWWLDPAGAGLLSLFIIYDWGETCFDNIIRLSGQAASLKLTEKLLYLGYRFSPVVEGFKSVTAYHAGDGIWVEYDLLMDQNSRLHTAHDVAETLQYCAEGLDEVDRAFVTTDYSVMGPTGHAVDAERA
ncbi:metal tolerance protein 11-like [Teratosphaeria destructans]|uniref:Metal tolerance protein 11-like n=1 Tax=Teratosphaeria destructans TaxID=418781 RepID=A0A9W7W6M1_9PEZI|nr:metal tolerance protein 11-like [Teratosphaeria destructans]